MATATLDTNNKWTTSISITPSLTAATTTTHSFSTAGKYVDRDIKVSATTPKLTSVTVPKDTPFTVTTTGATEYSEDAKLSVANGSYRIIEVSGNGTARTNNTVTEATAKTGGNIWVKAKANSAFVNSTAESELAAPRGIKITRAENWICSKEDGTTISNGQITPSAEQQGPFYGRTIVEATPAATEGTHTGARATITGMNVTLGTASDSTPSSPYIKVIPTSARYNIATAGWVAAGNKTVAAGAVRYYPVTGTTIANSVTQRDNDQTGYNDPVTTTTVSSTVPQISFTASGTAKAVLTKAASTATYINYFTGNYQYITT